MNKWIFWIVLLFPPGLFGAPTGAGTVFTNYARVNVNGMMMGQTNLSFTVGSMYGLGSLVSWSSNYMAYPTYQLRIPFYITNNANDADSNAQIFFF